jgi:hypothetical protein
MPEIIAFPLGGARLNGKLRASLTVTEAKKALKSATDPEVISDLEAAIRIARQGKATVKLATAIKI